MVSCFRKCQKCNWINCSKYIDLTAQAQRLRMKETNAEIQEWYEISFKIEWVLGGSVANG